MKGKIALTTLMAATLLSGSLSGAQTESASKSDSGAKTVTGVISDSMCGAKHMAKDKSAAECTRMCVKQGSDYALVVGKKVYVLKGNASDLDKYAGERVTVKGSVTGNTITAESINPATKMKKSKKSK